MVTIGDMLRLKGVKNIGSLKVQPGRPTHLTEMQPRDLVRLGFAVVVDDEDEEAQIRREDPIGADIMDQVFEMVATEDRRSIYDDLMEVFLLGEQAEEELRHLNEMGCGEPEH